jgi:energy-coupling factor transporter ATP-binding protein EcfA2
MATLSEEQLTKRINFLLGKNGSGKSRAMRDLDQRLHQSPPWYVKYITPERGGALTYDAGVDQNVAQGTWLGDTRRRNRLDQFRQQTVSQYGTLELTVLREIEKDPSLRNNSGYTFETIIDEINSLLPLVQLIRAGKTFEIHNKADGAQLQPDQISSGEAEAIALAIEALVFSRDCQNFDHRVLLIDEPDVHLHPDLQARLIRFLERLAKEKNFKIVIATHSTALVGSIRGKDEAQLAFMPLTSDGEITFSAIDEIVKEVVPIFGAHPLSNIFNETPILIVEGEDDERIWNQVVRSTEGAVSIWPCSAGSIEKICRWETWLDEKLPSLYDDPKAFSLRDRDEAHGDLNDLGPIVRCRLECRTAENLMLADDTLRFAGTTWEKVVEGCKKWLEISPDHPKYQNMKEFADAGFDRFNASLKEIRNILIAEIGVKRPWEVLVGQAIAKFAQGNAGQGDNSLRKYLGGKVCIKLLKL